TPRWASSRQQQPRPSQQAIA
ncbi:hypothetical protein A2U01_0107757, partial [Trifolium medium]|nr:hypothetical protein [Trifolium medium]